ncbi:MAG: DUF4174 domain-containing protein [Flavobacteriaceae bacterium]
MCRTIASLIIVLLCCYVSKGQSLLDYRWKNRLVFIVNPHIDQHGGHPQIKAFEGYTKAVQERDVLVYVLRKNKVFDLDGLIVNWTGKTVPYSSFKGIVLIGKDGSIKLKKPFLVSAKEIFDLIDSMPMRRAEMKDSVKD